MMLLVGFLGDIDVCASGVQEMFDYAGGVV
jgi:hypothetical protein